MFNTLKLTKMKANELTQRDVEFINQTARTISSYLKAGNPYIFYSWGAHNAKAILHDGKAALQLSVNGFKCKGRLIVAYNEGKDLFEVYTYNRAGRLLNKADEVYCDELQNICDRFVETENDKSPEYNNQCKKWFATL